MHLIFTMAGLYSRFENFSLNVPKYLLPYKNKSIFHEIVNAFTSKEIDKMSFIVNKRQILKLKRLIKVSKKFLIMI